MQNQSQPPLRPSPPATGEQTSRPPEGARAQASSRAPRSRVPRSWTQGFVPRDAFNSAPAHQSDADVARILAEASRLGFYLKHQDSFRQEIGLRIDVPSMYPRRTLDPRRPGLSAARLGLSAFGLSL